MRKTLFAAIVVLIGACHASASTLTISGTGTVTDALPGIGVSVDDALRFTATASDEIFSASSRKEYAHTEFKLDAFEATIGTTTIGNIPSDGSASIRMDATPSDRNSVTLYMSGPTAFDTTAHFHSLTIIWQFDSDEMDTSFAALAALDFSTAVATSVWAVDTRAPNDIGMQATLRAANTAQIPLPAGLWLGLAGLAGLGLVRARRRG